LVFTTIIYVCKIKTFKHHVMCANMILCKAGPSNINVMGANRIQMQHFVKAGPSNVIVLLGANRIQVQLKVLNVYNIITNTIQIVLTNDARRVF
jgi:hypothetical protein